MNATEPVLLRLCGIIVPPGILVRQLHVQLDIRAMAGVKYQTESAKRFDIQITFTSFFPVDKQHCMMVRFYDVSPQQLSLKNESSRQGR